MSNITNIKTAQRTNEITKLINEDPDAASIFPIETKEELYKLLSYLHKETSFFPLYDIQTLSIYDKDGDMTRIEICYKNSKIQEYITIDANMNYQFINPKDFAKTFAELEQKALILENKISLT